MPVARDVVASLARVSKLLHRKDVERMALDMPHIDDIRRLWSEGQDVTEIARVTGHDRKTVRKRLQMDDFSSEASRPTERSVRDPQNN